MYSVYANGKIIDKMRVNRFQEVRCYKCGRKYRLGDLQPKLFIEHDMSKFRPPDMGGNGYNYDCPHCHIPIYCPRW